MLKRRLLLAAFALAACRPNAAPAPVAAYDPAHALGPLFADVQNASVFPDSKTFVDARPVKAPAAVRDEYLAARGLPGFDLRAFVARAFVAPGAVGAGVRPDSAATMEEHITALWPVLTRP